jgi:hypothetical protein
VSLVPPATPATLPAIGGGKISIIVLVAVETG